MDGKKINIPEQMTLNILKNKKIILLFYFLLLTLISFAQEIGIGFWRTHLPYQRAIQVAVSKNKIYCANPSGLFSYNKTDNSIEVLSKITGLAEVEISTIRYSMENQTLVIGYSNGNIDLIQGNVITNLADIKRANVIGNKSINHIYFQNNLAYLACGFGIVVLDVSKKEIKDTYLIGNNSTYINVNAITSDGKKLFAATSNGIYSASLNSPNLAYYIAWTKYTNLPQPDSVYNAIVFFKHQIYANCKSAVFNSDIVYQYNGSSWEKNDSIVGNVNNSMEVNNNNKLIITHYGDIDVYDTTCRKIDHIYSYGTLSNPLPKHAILDDNNNLWIADDGQGLIKNRDTWYSEVISPKGPESINNIEMAASDGDIWVAPGSKKRDGFNVWERAALYSFTSKGWMTNDASNTPAMDTIFDIITVAIDPTDKKRVYAGSLGRGVLEFYDKKLVAIYNNSNSSLLSNTQWRWIGVTGLAFDSKNNLWVANAGVKRSLSVKKTDGTWKSFNFSTVFNDDITTANILINQFNQKWIILPRGQGILVFDDNYTIEDTLDDQIKIITNAKGNGNLPSNDVFCMAEDHNGEIWVGTDKGVAVFYSVENVFTENDFDAQQIYVQQDGYTQLLLETEVVTAIAVDGANRKWIGTQNSGVFLMSEDGTKQIHHFYEDNSPLLSNNIISLAIAHTTGEVYIGTEKGIISYKSTATSAGDEFQNVFAYPNPVRKDYDGTIGIKGLVKNTHVKITDVSGNLVYEAFADGGQATWNGKNLVGEKVHTGVYLVFCTNPDGSKTFVTKILVMN